MTVDLAALNGSAAVAIRYGWGNEQSSCCLADAGLKAAAYPCPPASCPIKTKLAQLPANPFMAAIVVGVAVIILTSEFRGLPAGSPAASPSFLLAPAVTPLPPTAADSIICVRLWSVGCGVWDMRYSYVVWGVNLHALPTTCCCCCCCCCCFF